jgi:transcription elongation factor GreA
MDADFRSYLKAAHGDEPPARADDARWAETEALARRLIESSQAEAALKALAQEPPAAQKRWDLLLLSGLLRLGLGDRDFALEALEVVGDKLVAAGDRAGVESLLPRFLEPEATSTAVRFLHYLAREAGEDAKRIPLLREALSIRPHSAELHGELAHALERIGKGSGAREHRLRAAELYLDAGRPEAVGEGLLRTVEEDIGREPARVAQILLRFASLAPWEEAEPFLELALPELEPRAAGRIEWVHVAPTAAHAPASAGARAILARFLRLVVAREPDPDAVVAGSGISNPSIGVEEVGTRIARILALPPGARVAHAAWGLGRVLANDGESVTLSFPGKEGHRMTLSMASRALDRLPSEGLRVVSAEQPERLRRWMADGSPDAVLAALRDLGGTATVAQLRQRLEPLLAGGGWAPYWKSMKERLRSDPRVDGREAYRQIYRILPEGASEDLDEVSLPELHPRQGAAGLTLLKQFLREHSDQEDRLREAAAPTVLAWAMDAKLEPAQRALALSTTASWEGAPESEIRALLADLIESGLAPDDVPLAQGQEQLLDLARDLDAEPEFLWRALESRLPRLRERGRTRLRDVLGPDVFAAAVEQRLTRPTGSTGVAARLLVHYAEHPGDQGAPPAATLLTSAIRLLERSRELDSRHAASLLALLAPEGALTRLLKAHPPDEATREILERTVLHWQGSERTLHPILDFLKLVGQEGIAGAYEARRSARASSLVEGRTLEDIETAHTIMSRATYRRLTQEMERLGLELKTSIPAAIEKARALGDLRENAEYEAAKQRQANAAARLQSMMDLLARTRLLESIEIDPSRAGIGTEVELEPLAPGQEHVRFWILGEGDNQLGPGIISYRAPVARPLLGKPVGSEVTIPTIDGERRYRITAIEKRLPAET